MFLTCVARRRNSRPSALGQSTRRRGCPRRLEIAGRSRLDLRRAGRVADIPERVDAVVLGERLGERVRFAGDDVDDAGGDIRRVEHLIEVGRAASGWRGRGNGDDAIAHRDRRHDQRDEGEQRRLVRADDAHDAPRLVHRQRDEARARRVHGAVELVGLAGVDRTARRIDASTSASRRARGGAGHRAQPVGEFARRGRSRFSAT